jgi:hypothetical protein
MSDPPTHVGNERAPDDDSGVSLSTITLFAGARQRIREHPRAALALLLAGTVVIGLDWLRLHDPIPAVGFSGIQDGRFSILFSVVVTVFSRTTVPVSALVGLKPQWLAWAIGLELLGLAAVAGAGAYALARLLQVPLTTSAILRYAGIVILLRFGPRININGGMVVTILLGIPLLVVFLFLLVRLFAFPGLLIAEDSIRTALRGSWRRTKGHGWSLLAVIILLGILNHLLTSIPVIGPLGSAVVAVLHAGTVATFLHHS